MKKILIILGALFANNLLDAYDQRINDYYRFISSKKASGLSFMFTRPVYYHLMMRKHLWHDFVHNPRGSQGISGQAIGYYQNSLPTKATTQYFFPCDNTCLLVSGDNNTEDLCKRNIRAEWLYLSPDFKGLMTIKPEQKQAGGSAEILIDLYHLSKWDFFKSSWVSVELPCIWVENNINLQQDILRPGPQDQELPQDICQAFTQPDWCYAKLGGRMSEKALAEVRFVLGKNYLSENHFEIDYYTSLICPTGNLQNPEYTFSPVVGNNKHWGFAGGTDYQILLNRDTCNFYGTFFLDFEAVVLFHNEQKRTFDLRCRPWSRYLLFVDKCRPGITVPGPNVLTLRSAVTPYFFADFSMGWRLEHKWFECEFGYNVWGHGNEKITLHEGFDRCWGIAGEGTIPDECDGIVPATASRSTIACQTENDEFFTPIKETDIDLRSGASFSSLNHTAHFAIGGTRRCENYGVFAGVGIFAEWPEKNSALKLWGTWAKLGTTF